MRLSPVYRNRIRGKENHENHEHFPEPEIEVFLTNSHEMDSKDSKKGLTSKSEKVLLDMDGQVIRKKSVANRKSNHQLLAKAVANPWVKLGNGKKEYYRKLAEIDLERYNKAMNIYTYKLQSDCRS